MKDTKSDNLFKEFHAVSAKQWVQQIQVDLKGADYNDTLLWQSEEGIDVKPFYHEDTTTNKFNIPGQPDAWRIAQAIFIDDIGIAKRLAKEVLDKGATALRLIADKTFDIATFFDGWNVDNAKLYFELLFWDQAFYLELSTYLTQNKIAYSLGMDPIGYLAKEGNWPNETNQLDALSKIVEKYPTQSIRVDTRTYQNAGANIVQQLAYALSHAKEYLHILNKKKVSLNNLKLVFHVAIGSNYFFEIAKLRALRLLYATLAKEYNANPVCEILAMPTKRNKTIYDYNVNMLRTTTECMSAILGGANTIENMPY